MRSHRRARQPTPERSYRRFRRLDGRHPWKRDVPLGYVDYAARRRRGGRVVWFNFDLAREMGLLPRDHEPRLTPGLAREILRTFGLQIINEWDLEHGVRVPARDRLPGTYMATRYLQLQHPDRRGESSGDGRSVWNGTLTCRGVTWDVSSCGTGVTRLCPATALEKRFFKTGNRYASYGCGTAALAEGISSALMSETFHRNGIPTERVLAVIAYGKGFGVTVRAARCLLRPSHLFVHLRRGDLASLRAAADFYVRRRIANGDWPVLAGARRWRFLAEDAARSFARAAALFESEYVFVWLDWDGDNVLADGAIIDYGSVRQFGLFHREYRFEDVDRMSTSIVEQRRKARALVRSFVQIRELLLTGRKPPLASLSRDPALALFDATFERERVRLLLRRIGLPPDLAPRLLRREAARIERFRRAHAWFERARSSRGPEKVADGISWNAVYCTRDLLRELPARLCAGLESLGAREILEIAASSYASRADRRPTPARLRRARELQRAYLELLGAAARESGTSLEALLADVARRSAQLNRADRITGDAIDYATARLVRNRLALGPARLQRLMDRFVRSQDRDPDRAAAPAGEAERALRGRSRRVFDGLLDLVHRCREGL